MIYKNTAIRALSLIVALATSFFSYGDEDPASIQHRYMTPSMRVSTNAWLSVSGNVERIVSAATNGLATAEDLGGYLQLSGGTLTGDLAVGEWYTASRKLTVSAEKYVEGITLQGGKYPGTGSSVTVGGSSGGGGEIRIQGGGSTGGRLYVGGYYGAGGGAIEVSGMGASIKKDGSEVATETYVNTQVSGVESTLTTLAGAVNSKADKSALDNHEGNTNNPHKVTAAQIGSYTKAEVDAKGYVTEAVTNGLATAESVDGLAADVAGKADAADVYAKDEADARFYPADEGALWASWWSGDGFRVAVSNYDVSASSAAWDRLPSASFDYRPGGTGTLVRVWSENTRWERHRAEAAAFSNAVDMALAGKAGLDWGRTTPTGFDAPEGFTWLDTPAVAVAGGLAWQRTVTSEGAVWLLCSNGMVAESGGATNGSFRVVDMATGEPAFEVVQGERRTVGANCGEVYTWKAEDGKTHMRVVYNVESDAPPVLHVAEALKPNGGTVWHDEGAEGCPAQFAGWTGSSGAWTNALWRASAPAAGERDALFCFATYEKVGETVVKNHAPVSMSKIVVGGVTYSLGTATVGGHTVLTLTEAK